MSVSKLLSLLTLSLISLSCIASASKELSITRITPAGDEVVQQNQLVIEFNRPVVPLGRMERRADEIPVTIVPKLDCQWRWLTHSTLACQLDAKTQLQRATRYQITVNPGIRAEDGATLAKSYQHTFTTERPDIDYASIKTWLKPGLPVLKLTTTQPIKENSLVKHVFFSVADKRIAGKIYRGKLPLADQPEVKYNQDRIWLLVPEKPLPLGKTVQLSIEPGLESRLGSELGSTINPKIYSFATFPSFKLLGLRCYSNDSEEIFIKPGEKPEQACNPLASVSLVFNSPVLYTELRKQLQITPSYKLSDAEDETPETAASLLQDLHNDQDKQYVYSIYPQDVLAAAQHYALTIKASDKHNWWQNLEAVFTKTTATDFKDAFSRPLDHTVQLEFVTAHRKPNYDQPYHDAVLEKAVDSEVPLYVTNLDKLEFNYSILTAKGLSTNQHQTVSLPKVADVQFAVPLEIRKLLNGQTGVVDLKLYTKPVVNQWPIRLEAQVTPYQIQAKLGHFSSLAWVTDLTTGQPVSDVEIKWYRASNEELSEPSQVLATAKTDANGIAILPGTMTLKPIHYDEHQSWYLSAIKANDMGWLPLTGTYKMSGYDLGHIYSWRRPKYEHIVTWGTTAQGIYRPGDTLQYKIYIRNQNDLTLVPAPKEGYQLRIIDPTGKTVAERKELKLDEFGSIQGELSLSKEAVAGWYQFELGATFNDDTQSNNRQDEENRQNHTWQPLRVLVSDFTPAPFKVVNQLNNTQFRAEQTVEISASAKLHAGGVYGNATVRHTASLQQRSFSSQQPQAKDFSFNQANISRASQEVYQKTTQLTAQGESIQTFKIPKQDMVYGKLVVETAVQDERGKYVSAQTQADYFGLDRLVGLKLERWLYTAKQPAKIQYLVVDDQGKPVSDTEVNLTIERQVNQVAKVKSEGSAYLSHYTTSWEPESHCQGLPKAQPLVCEFTPNQAGTYRISASNKDSQGRTYLNQQEFWVVGSDYVLWNQDEDSALSIVPEKSAYQVGDKAKFLIKNPYPGAKALISVERYGIITQWVQTLSGSTPVIEVPIKPDYLPGFYLSVAVVSPRVEKSAEQPAPKLGQLDLGKPSMKAGYVQITVDDPYKQLNVQPTVDKKSYKPGEQVNLQIQAKPRMSDSHQPIEFAVAVVDEAVIDLLDNMRENYDIYHGLYQLNTLDVDNYSLLNRLIGRQKFAKKGANPGGDGGSSFAMRSIFKYVSYWNPAIKADDKGRAQVHFTVPDNLTKWRVLVLAATPRDHFGLGQTEFIVNRPTEIRPVLPNQVTEGDSFNAGFSIMNRTDKPRELKVEMQVSGVVADKTVHQSQLKLAPYERKPVTLAVQTQTSDRLSQLQFKIIAGDEFDKDGLSYGITVRPLQITEVVASHGTTTEPKTQEQLLLPKAARKTQLTLSLTPTVIGNIDGAFRYAKAYPYICWEQRLTKALLAAQYKALSPYLASNMAWPEADELPAKTLAMAANYQAPNGGMAYFSPLDNRVDPYLSAYTALAFNWFKRMGYEVPEVVQKKLQGYLNNLLREANTPDFYTEGMTATIRAVTLAALAEQQPIDASDLERLRIYLPRMSLFGKAYYLQAALQSSQGQALAKTIWQNILSQADQTPGQINFTQTLDDSYQRILTSRLRDNCAVLDAILMYQQKAEDGKTWTDFPVKMVKSITQARGRRDHWENTQENLFCANALIHYSQVYEKTVPKMHVQAFINQQKLGEAEFTSLRSPAASLSQDLGNTIESKPLTLLLSRQGEGRYYYTTRLSYVPNVIETKDTNAGIELHREYSVERNGQWVLLTKINNRIKRGELVRVDLYLNLPGARNFVVVDDPVPGGLEPVNSELATSSKVDANKAKSQMAGGAWWYNYSDWNDFGISYWSFYHQEFRDFAVRFYSDYLEPGHYHLSYVAQAISPGKFSVMPSLAEEMYQPEVFGRAAGWQLLIDE